MNGAAGNHPHDRVLRHGPWRVTEVDSTGSTNLDLAVAARNGAPDGTVLRAGHQTAGRGRLDRRWDAPAGANLLMSVLFRVAGPVAADAAHRHVRAVALAARAAVAASVGVAVGLKWPNDLVVDDHKLAGILAQLVEGAPGESCVVVGLGLNIGWAPSGAACLSEMVGAAALESAGVSPHSIMLAILDHLAEIRTLDEVDLRARHEAALVTIGRRVRLELPGGGTSEGVATSIDGEGRLVVLGDDGATRAHDVADVVHLRDAPD